MANKVLIGESVQDYGVSLDPPVIKGSSDVGVTSSGNTTVITTTKHEPKIVDGDGERYSGYVDLVIPDDYSTLSEAYEFAVGDSPYAWSRASHSTAARGFRLKVLTRTHYDFEADKNYNFYFILTVGNGGKILKVEGEFREEAFPTTLHEHAIPLQGTGSQNNGGNQ